MVVVRSESVGFAALVAEQVADPTASGGLSRCADGPATGPKHSNGAMSGRASVPTPSPDPRPHPATTFTELRPGPGVGEPHQPRRSRCPAGR
ncbi:hypothetical protein ATKI12_4233 [Kitasatospora sp. Ki12]